MKLTNKLAVAGAMVAAILAGQSALAQDGFPLTITDAAGIEHMFETPPKIGCAWTGCTEMMADLGLQFQASTSRGEGDIFNFPVGNPVHQIADWGNPEYWAAAEVDVIFIRVPFGEDAELFSTAAPAFHLHHPSYGESSQTGYGAYIENLRIFGQITGETERADAAIIRFETMVTNLKAMATDETRANTVAMIRGGEGRDNYTGFGATNPFCVLIAEIGFGQCVPGTDVAPEYELNAEAFLELDPDWIVYMGGGHASRTGPIWDRLSAVQNDHVIDTSDRAYCCSTRGLIHALQDYTHFIVDSSVPAAGNLEDFDPTLSPLVQSN